MITGNNTENKFEQFIQDDIGIRVENGKVKLYEIVNNEWILKLPISTKNPLSTKVKDLIFESIRLRKNPSKEEFPDFKKNINQLIENFFSKYQQYLDIEKEHADEIAKFDMDNRIKEIDNEKTKKEPTQEEIEYKKEIDRCVKEIFELNNIHHTTIMETALYSLFEHQGDDELKELCILSIASMSISNLIEPIHLHAYGLAESGKTYLLSKTKEIIPEERKLISDNVSPKVLFRARLKPNMVISLNDKIIDESFGELLNCICDGKSWENGFIYTVIGENGEPIDHPFPPRIIFHISTNKPIPEYHTKEMRVDLEAVQSKFFSFKKEYSENQKNDIKEKMLERINNDLQKNKKNLDVMQQIFEILISNPKNIHIPFSREIIENYMGSCGIRDFGQICSLCQTYALLSGYDNVNKECIEHILGLLNKIPRESKILKDNSALALLVMMPKKYFHFDEKVSYYNNCTVEGISNLLKLSISTMRTLLRDMAKNGLIEYITKGKGGTKYYYKLKDEILPGWLIVELKNKEKQKTPEPETKKGIVDIRDL